jgi:hypothetical protein
MKRISQPPIKKIVKEVLESLGQGGRLAELVILSSWEEIVGSRISSRTAPLYIKGGALTVAVYNSVWMHQLSFLKSEMAGKINDFTGERTVSSIKFVLRKKPDWVSKPRSEPEKARRDPAPEDMERIDEACSSIGDAELRNIVRRLLIHQALVDR